MRFKIYFGIINQSHIGIDEKAKKKQPIWQCFINKYFEFIKNSRCERTENIDDARISIEKCHFSRILIQSLDLLYNKKSLIGSR